MQSERDFGMQRCDVAVWCESTSVQVMVMTVASLRGDDLRDAEAHLAGADHRCPLDWCQCCHRWPKTDTVTIQAKVRVNLQSRTEPVKCEPVEWQPGKRPKKIANQSCR